MGEAKPSHQFERGKRMVLLVDGDVNSGFYLSTLLKRFNYDICTAGSVEEALALAVRTKPSLIITSVSLPDQAGPELLQQFKKNPATDAVALIALLKKKDPEMLHHCFACGATDYLIQPVPAEQLYRSVQKATETRPRKDIRVRTLQPVKIHNSFPETFETACILDLSECGMFLHATKPTPVNTQLSLQIDLNRMIIPVEAMVVYSYRTPTGPYLQGGMGLKFLKIDPQDQGYIRQFIREEVMRGMTVGSA
jgi:CheY-like chemotaxis protein